MTFKTLVLKAGLILAFICGVGSFSQTASAQKTSTAGIKPGPTVTVTVKPLEPVKPINPVKPVKPNYSAPPNLYPSWLNSWYTPTWKALSYNIPWINNGTYVGHAATTLLNPQGEYFVQCDGDMEVGQILATVKNLASSSSDRFGAQYHTENPCKNSEATFSACTSANPTAEQIATATANAYVSLSAFSGFFKSLGWEGLDGNGTPVGIVFGPRGSYPGWNRGIDAPLYCAGHSLHLNVHIHELVHGIVRHTADFAYNFGGTGGPRSRNINEAYADFFGEMVEFWAAIPDTSKVPGLAGDYEVITGKNSQGATKPFYAQDVPCYTGTFGNGGNAIYADGGPIRHAMYIMAEGTHPTNGLPQTSPCSGPAYLPKIGRQNTSKIFFDALTQCDWRADGQTIDFCDARRCTVAAATCPDRDRVVKAWTAVDLNASVCGVTYSPCIVDPNGPLDQ